MNKVTKIKRMLRIRTNQLAYLEIIIRKEGLKNLKLTGHSEVMRSKRKQQETYLMSFWDMISKYEIMMDRNDWKLLITTKGTILLWTMTAHVPENHLIDIFHLISRGRKHR